MSGARDPVDLLLRAGVLDADAARAFDVAIQRVTERVGSGNLTFEQATRVLTNHFKRALETTAQTLGPFSPEQLAAAEEAGALIAAWIGADS